MNFFKKHKNIITTEIIFLLISLIFLVPLQFGFSPAGDDWGYHVGRIAEIASQLKNGNFFPQTYTHTFLQIGYPLNIFYPWITLIPFAFFMILIKNQVIAIMVGIVFYIFLGLNLSYSVGKRFFSNNTKAFFSSVIYMTSGYLITDIVRRFALGEFLALIFLPVCLYGAYAVFFGNKRDWPFLAFGLSFILLSHILSTFITILTLVGFGIVALFIQKDFFKRLKELSLAALVCIASSAIFIVPFLEQQTYQKFGQPSPQVLKGEPIDQIFFSSLNNNATNIIIGPIYILIILLGIFFWKHLTKKERISYLLGVAFFLSTTSLFPWIILNKTPINVIQFPFRILILATVFLAIPGGSICYQIISNIKTHSKQVITAILVLIAISLPAYSQINQLMVSFDENPGPKELFDKNYDIYAQSSGLWLDQYTPVQGLNYLGDVASHIALVDDNKEAIIAQSKTVGNNLVFDNKQINSAHEVDLPMFDYKNLHIYRDGKEVKKYISKRHTIEVKSSTTGPITVKYIPSLIDKLAYSVSILTWLGGLVYLCLPQKYKNRKKLNNE